MTSIRNLQARRANKDDEGGFTLIELLIVVVVLGILAAIVVLAVQNLTKDSAVTACKADARTIETAQELKKAKTTSYGALTTGAADSLIPDYVKSAPSGGTRYAITTDASTGKVMVLAPNPVGGTGTPVDFRATGATADPCKNAA